MEASYRGGSCRRELGHDRIWDLAHEDRALHDTPDMQEPAVAPFNVCTV